MPGKKFKSIGIREKLYNTIEEEKKEGESISDYIERVIDISTIRPIQPYEAIGDTNEAIEGLRRDIALYIDGKDLVTSDKEGLTKKDLKQALLGLENDIDMKIRDMLNEVMNKL